jgi:hypothetical protein
MRFIGRVLIFRLRKGEDLAELVAWGNNLVVNGGLDTLSNLMAGGLNPVLKMMAIGDSNKSPDLTQVALQGTEAQRVVATVSSPGPMISVDALFPGDSSRLSDVTVREFGVFASDNSLVSRWTCNDILVLRTDQLGVNWTLQPTQGT